MRIFISIPIGRSVKYFLDTPLYRFLRERHELTVFCSFASEEFQQIYGGRGVRFLGHPGISQRVLRALLNRTYMRFRLFHADMRMAEKSGAGVFNLTIRKKIFKFSYPWCRLLYPLLKHAGGWQRLTRIFSSYMVRPWYEKIFNETPPDMVISTAPSKSLPDYCMQASAVRHSIPLVMIPSSWDNFTWNGEFPFMPDAVMSWGPEMNRHAREFFNFEASKLIDTGILRFENTVDPEASAATLKEKLDIPPHHRIILFPANNHLIVGGEPEVFEKLVEEVKRGKLGEATLVLRLNNTWGPRQKAYMKRYSGDPAVRINLPENDGDARAFEKTAVSWNEVISHSDVVITICSMMVLEAFHWDRPVINLDYDCGIMNKYGYSHRVYYDREVYRKIRETGSTVFAKNHEDLCDAIIAYLKTPELHREERRKVMALWDVPPGNGMTRSERAMHEISRLLRVHHRGRT